MRAESVLFLGYSLDMLMNDELLMYFARVELAERVAAAEQRRQLRVVYKEPSETAGEPC